jgi:hypothetical protein
MSSKIGVSTKENPARDATFEKTSMAASQRADSSGKRSRVPIGVWKVLAFFDIENPRALGSRESYYPVNSPS